jgi:hypothetical protein
MMRSPAIPWVVAALFLLLPCAVTAQDDPEAVFGKFHRAILAANLDDMIKYGTPGGLTDIAKLPADKRKQVLDAMKSLTPPRYKITGRQLSNDGTKLTLRMTGSGASMFGVKADPQDGVTVMVKQGGEWKVDEVNWKDAKGRTAAAPETTSPPPGGKLGTADAPCVIKPVMTNADRERCR